MTFATLRHQRVLPLNPLDIIRRVAQFFAATGSLVSGTVRRLCLVLLALVAFLATSPAFAGGGPENVLLVVNANSESSKTIANHYVEMRKIPAQNVLYINWRGGMRGSKGEVFRNRVLAPAIEWIQNNKLNAQIDYLIYSTDFPLRIDLQDLFPPDKVPPRFNRNASLTGATYLTPFVLGRDPAMVLPNVNWYVPGPTSANVGTCQQLANVPTRAFRAVYLWDKEGKRTTDVKAGQRYLLSTTLGVTYGRGNTTEEILSYLKKAVEADGTKPKGTIYFMENENIRSRVRSACFAGVAAEINKLGVRAVVAKGTIPRGAPDVMGLMAGVNVFDWSKSGSTIRPGAICEHLTSYGGDMSPDASQTPLSEFLRQGAAGSSGTVTEPGAIQAKFPLPSLQLHYARGASLAEAFYQSVTGPFQLLIVGDPLCQPWANIPNVTAEGIKPGQELKGTVSIKPAGTTSDGQSVRLIDLFIDGKLSARTSPGQTLNVDTTKLADGYHEIRLVGVSGGPIETQGRIIVPVTINNRNAALEFKVSPFPTVELSGKLHVAVKLPGATSIAIRQNSRVLARVKGEAGEVEIPAVTLGRGPTTLQAFTEGEVATISAPVQVTVE